MATRVWNDETEGDVWLVHPEPYSKDLELDTSYSSDSEATISSMETIDSAEIGDYFRVEYGRTFPKYDDLPMALPADPDEIYRLKIQHIALKKVVGGALDTLIEAQLAPSPDGRRKCILDVRTQSGIWAEEIAIKFPNVDVKTIDVAPTVPHYPRPNLHHEVYDIHAGILEPTGSFDIVHARHTVNMVKDWKSMLREIHRVLRPGGMLIFGEIDPRLTLPGQYVPALHGSGCRGTSFFEFYRQALVKGGILIEASSEIDDWLRPDSDTWSASPPGFHRLQHRSWEVPTNGLWHPDPVMQEVGMLMAMNFREFIGSARPLFLSHGVLDAEFDEWVEAIRQEIRDPMNDTVIRYHLVTAFKLS